MIYLICSLSLAMIIFGVHIMFIPNMKTHYKKQDFKKFINVENKLVVMFNNVIKAIENILVENLILSDLYISVIQQKLYSVNSPYKAKRYLSNIIAKCIFMFGSSVVLSFGSPIIMLIVGIYCVYFYQQKIRDIDLEITKARQEIESDMLRFVNTLAEKVELDRNIIGFFNMYSKTTNKSFAIELQKTVNDMKSNNDKIALENLRQRVNSRRMTEVIQGLISIIDGADSYTYFSNLAEKYKVEDIEKIRLKVKSEPKKIEKYSWAVAGVFFALLLYIILYLIKENISFIL